MKRSHFFYALILIAGAVLSLASCNDCVEGNGKLSTRTVNINPVDGIKLNLAADVVLVPDTVQAVEITGESNIIELITLEQNAGRLRISSEPCISSYKPVTIRVPVRNLNDLQINGSGDIKSSFPFRTDELELGINGSGDIDLEVEALHMRNQINGSGNIYLKGSAQDQHTDINGSGNLEAENLACSDAKVTINGSGNAKLLVTKNLDATVRGSGSIYYSGSPQVSTTIKGSGEVEKVK